MSSVKCPQCGLVKWSTAASCKRCGLPIADGPVDEHLSQSYAPTGVTNYFPSHSFDEEQLIRNLRRDSDLFYFIGGLQTLAWLVIGHLLIVDAVFNVGLSFLTNKFKSRIAAVALLLLTLMSVLIGFVGLATGGIRFNPFVPLVLLGRLAISIRMVYSTFKLNALADLAVAHTLPPPPPDFHHEERSQWAQPGGSAQWQPE